MPNTILKRTGRFVTATAFAAAIGVAGVSTVLLLDNNSANAQISVELAAPPPSFADLVEAVSPAVVSIQVESEVQVRQLGPNGGMDYFPDLPEDHPLRRFFEQLPFGPNSPMDRPQQRPRRAMAAGSGFIISADGFVVTNNHVVANADRVTVTFENGDEHEATVIGTDERTDLAVIKMDDVSDLPFVEFADEEARVGDWVVAVGNPFGLGGSVTAGVISARGRDIGVSQYGDFLQIDAAINTGNSGGPAFGLDGQVVGVNTAIYSPNGGNVGIAFAIPAEVVKRVVFDLIEDGNVTRGFLGVSLQNIDSRLAEALGLDDARGAMVTEPTPGYPAEAAGIESGDVIVSVNDDPIDNALDLTRTISNLQPGTPITVTVFRDGEEISFEVTLDVYDESQLAQLEPEIVQAPPPEQPAVSSVGLVLAPNAGGDGLLVEDVEPDSIASDLGFMQGDVILEADGDAVSSVDQFETVLAAVRDRGSDTVTIKLTRGNAVRFVGMPLSGN
jgi:serine protease Do